MPSSIQPNKMVVGNPTGTAYIQVDKPAGANGYNELFIYVSPDPQEFTLAGGASLNLVLLNGSTILKKNIDWTQVENTLTLLSTVVLSDNDEVTAIGNI